MTEERLTRKEKRELRKQGKFIETPPTILKPIAINPLTTNQELTYNAFNQGKHLLLTGTAGTGKTFLSLYLALQLLTSSSQFKRIVIVRSLVSSRSIGFLPGTSKEKAKVYEAPYIGIFSELFGRGDAYEIFKQKGFVEFIPTSFVRGTTIDNAIVIVDECQNMIFHECDSIMTRMGNNTRIIFSGDIKQNDLASTREVSGLQDFMKIIKKLKGFAHIEFTIQDVVRSGIVRSYLIAKDKLEQAGEISLL